MPVPEDVARSGDRELSPGRAGLPPSAGPLAAHRIVESFYVAAPAIINSLTRWAKVSGLRAGLRSVIRLWSKNISA